MTTSTASPLAGLGFTGSGMFATVPNGFGGTTTVRATDSRAQAVASPPRASKAQVKYVRDLLASRDASDPAVAALRLALNTIRDAHGFLPADTASNAITALRSMPVAPTPEPAPVVRTNRYAGKCEDCGTTVEPEAGILTKTDEGKWEVAHKPGECPVSAFPFPNGRYAVANEDGDLRFYVADNDGLFVLASDNLHRVHTSAQDAIVAKIAADPMAASIAFGKEWQVCGRCGRGLTDTTPGGSRDQGIGPVCRTRSWQI